jgi:hypothetical protein
MSLGVVEGTAPIQPTAPQENAPLEIIDTKSLRQEPQDRVESREAEEAGISDQLLSPAPSQEEVAQPITPTKETPTPATEGTVMPGGVGIERDVTKPEQMTPEEYLTPRIAKLEAEIAELEANQPNVNSKAYLYWQPRLTEAKRNLKALKEDRDEPGTDKPWAPGLQQRFIFEALDANEPVSAAAVDSYGIKLPEGYVKQGDLYVFQPKEFTSGGKQPLQTGSGTGTTRQLQAGKERGETKALESEGISVTAGEYITEDEARAGFQIAVGTLDKGAAAPDSPAILISEKLSKDSDAVKAIYGFPNSVRGVLTQIHLGLPVSIEGDNTQRAFKIASEAPKFFPLAKNYTRQGDLYVFQPGATGEPVQAAPSAAQAVKAAAPGPVFQRVASEMDTMSLKDLSEYAEQQGMSRK